MEFKITYEIKGEHRKKLVEYISDHLNTISKHLIVPTCAYEIRELTVDCGGAIIINNTITPSEVEAMVNELEAAGFIPTNYGENAFDGIEISMPREMFTDKVLESFHRIVLAKGNVIAKAIGSMDLRIIKTM